MTVARYRSFLVDDEPLAIERLTRLLADHPEIEIAGSATNPHEAARTLSETSVDVLFLDIKMPGMNGFELLSNLKQQPIIIFTTAFDQYALRAFEANSIDYLLKPIEPEQLDRAVKKLGRMRDIARPTWLAQLDARELLKELAASAHSTQGNYQRRIASQVGERISFIELDQVTHFFAHEKLTFAVANGTKHCVDESLLELEAKLDASRFLRIHRSTLLNLDWVYEINSWFAGRVVVTLKDTQRTQLTVARDRVRDLKDQIRL